MLRHQESDGALLYPEETKTLVSYKPPSVLDVLRACDCKNSWNRHPSSRQQLRAAEEGGDLSCDTGGACGVPMSLLTVHQRREHLSKFYDRVSKLIC